MLKAMEKCGFYVQRVGTMLSVLKGVEITLTSAFLEMSNEVFC
jgi:hypothetical protein